MTQLESVVLDAWEDVERSSPRRAPERDVEVVIIGIDDRDVASVSDYMEALANLTVGQRVKVRVQRGDEQKSFDVKVGQRSQ